MHFFPDSDHIKKWLADMATSLVYAATWLAKLDFVHIVATILAILYLYYRVRKERSNSRAAATKEENALLEKKLLEIQIKKFDSHER